MKKKKFNYDAKYVASEEEIQSKLFQTTCEPGYYVDAIESFKLTCDVASVFSLLFTPSSFVHEQLNTEQPLSVI